MTIGGDSSRPNREPRFSACSGWQDPGPGLSRLPRVQVSDGQPLRLGLRAEALLPRGERLPSVGDTLIAASRPRRYFRLLRYARMSPTSCALSVCHEVFFATILDSIPAPCSHIPATIQYADAWPSSLAKLGAPLY